MTASDDLSAAELAEQARALLVSGDLTHAASTIARLDERSRGGQDRWFAATTRMLEAELAVAQGAAVRGAHQLDVLARWLAARPEAPLGLVVGVAASRVVAHLAAGQVAALPDAVSTLERLAPGAPLAALGRGFSAEHAGKLDAARAHYQVAARGPAGCALEAHLALARLAPHRAEHLAAATALVGGDHPRGRAAHARAALAVGRYLQARTLADQLDPATGVEALLVRAEIACAASTRDEARGRIALLGVWAQEHGARALQAHAYLLAARITDDPIERAMSIRAARELATEVGDTLILLRARLEQATMALDLGHPEEALAIALELEAAAEARGRDDLTAAAALVLGLAAQALGHRDAAAHLGRAQGLAAAHGQITVAVRALDALGRGDEASTLRAAAGLAAS